MGSGEGGYKRISKPTNHNTAIFLPVLCTVLYVAWSFLNVKLLYFSVVCMQQD